MTGLQPFSTPAVGEFGVGIDWIGVQKKGEKNVKKRNKCNSTSTNPYAFKLNRFTFVVLLLLDDF